MEPNQTEKVFFEWLKKNRNLTEVNIEKIRELNKKLSQFVDSPADLLSKDLFIQCKAGHSLKLRYYFIDNQIRPLIIYLPGNGFCYDLFIENHAIISKIAKTSGCHAISVDYRLAPENPYPAQLEDALETFHFIMNNLDKFRADRGKIILSGYSSGANLAAVITNKMSVDKKYPIFHQLLMSGAYDYTNSLHDYDEYGIKDELLSPEEIKFSFDSYSKESQRKEPSCSPYWSKNLSGLPNTTIVVAEYDGGRSQSEGYADKLIKSGNKVTKIILPGQTHGTILYRKALSEGKDPALVIGEHVKKLFNQKTILNFNIVSIEEKHIEGFWHAVDAVSRERKYLTFLEAPPIETTKDFVLRNINEHWPHLVAIYDEKIIGWCDITSLDRPIFAHVGSLGIAVLANYRGQGVGEALIQAALRQAKTKGLTRIELTVFENNKPAIALYEKLGFVVEGVHKNKSLIDGQYENHIFMAIFI